MQLRKSVPRVELPASLLGYLVVVTLLVAGCQLFSTEQGTPGVEFDNRADVAVDVVFRNADGQESSLTKQLKPGTVIVVDAFTTDCSNHGTFIARDEKGNEVARRDGPVCRPSTWVIEANSSQPPAS